TEGVPGLYRGYVPGILNVSHGALQFMAYEELKTLYVTSRGLDAGAKLDTTAYLCCAALSKLFAVTITYPQQLLRARLQDQHNRYDGLIDVIRRTWRARLQDQHNRYDGLIDVIRRTWRFEGLRGYYKGLLPNLMKVTPAYMELKPEIYQSLNYLPKEFAIKTFTRLRDENKSYGLVVDLGPGDGGLTKVLSTYVNHKRIVALDIDPGCISHCKQINGVKTIEYEIQDLGVEWDQFRSDLKRQLEGKFRSDLKRQLEGKVELIFSNFTLHFIPNKRQLLEVISRLLAPNGIIHANFIVISDLNKKLPIDDRKPEYLSVDQQIDIWRESIVDNGLKITEFSVVDAVWHMSHFIPVPVGFYRTFIKAGQPFDGKRLTGAVFDALINPGADQPNPNAWKEFLANESITKVTIHVKVMSFIAVK
ncbi:unnamed protein product, partial [Oppiella nova]